MPQQDETYILVSLSRTKGDSISCPTVQNAFTHLLSFHSDLINFLQCYLGTSFFSFVSNRLRKHIHAKPMGNKGSNGMQTTYLGVNLSKNEHL